METVINNNSSIQLPADETLDISPLKITSTSKPFIEANTLEGSLSEIRDKHIIPVFIKDNEPVINHGDFIEATTEVISDVFHGETILKPNIRLSHPIKGEYPKPKISLPLNC